MCTAVTYQTRDFYFGRTLDLERSYGEEVTFTPRNYPLDFRNVGTLERHYAIIGMARVEKGNPLYFDGVNEKGLAMAGLNFVGYARYQRPEVGWDNIAHFELIAWILATCATVEEARGMLAGMRLTGEAFSRELPPAQLHWMIADNREAVTLEAVEEGLRIYPNPVGVLTNNPPFDMQLFQLNNFLNLSPEHPESGFAPGMDLSAYSRGMGAMGLPGDLSSQSRFVRAAFVKGNARSGKTEAESVGQFFHILGAVNQPMGCCRTETGEYEKTVYTSCCNASRGIYYYTTYGNRQITAVDMGREDMDGRQLRRYPLRTEEAFFRQN